VNNRDHLFTKRQQKWQRNSKQLTKNEKQTKRKKQLQNRSTKTITNTVFVPNTNDEENNNTKWENGAHSAQKTNQQATSGIGNIFTRCTQKHNKQRHCTFDWSEKQKQKMPSPSSPCPVHLLFTF